MNFFCKMSGRSSRQSCFLVEEIEKTDVFNFEEFNTILIIDELNFRHIQCFIAIKFLFVLQDPFVEELLKFLVTVVDAKLFERIIFEKF